MRACVRAIKIRLYRQLQGIMDEEREIREFFRVGLFQNVTGHIRFSHKTFQEYMVARHILASGEEAHLDPAALDLGVALFLCSQIADVTNLLEEHLRISADIESLFPLLLECSRAGCAGGRFEHLYEAIVLGSELGVELTYGLRGPDVEKFTESINTMVETCVAFKPKLLSVLKSAAWDIMMGTPWNESRLWFERVVAGLE